MTKKNAGGLQNPRISQVSNKEKALEERLDKLEDLCADTETDLIDCIKEGLQTIREDIKYIQNSIRNQ